MVKNHSRSIGSQKVLLLLVLAVVLIAEAGKSLKKSKQKKNAISD